MATLYISEFKQGVSGIGSTWAQMLPQPAILDQPPIAIGAGSVASAAFNQFTRAVQINTDVACSIVFGDAPVATVANLRMSPGETRTYAVQPGQKVAVIANT